MQACSELAEGAAHEPGSHLWSQNNPTEGRAATRESHVGNRPESSPSPAAGSFSTSLAIRLSCACSWGRKCGLVVRTGVWQSGLLVLFLLCH